MLETALCFSSVVVTISSVVATGAETEIVVGARAITAFDARELTRFVTVAVVIPTRDVTDGFAFVGIARRDVTFAPVAATLREGRDATRDVVSDAPRATVVAAAPLRAIAALRDDCDVRSVVARGF